MTTFRDILDQDPVAQDAIQAFCDSPAGQLAFAVVREELATPKGIVALGENTFTEAAQFAFYRVVGVNNALDTLRGLGTQARREEQVRKALAEEADAKVKPTKAWSGRRKTDT